MPTVQMSLHNSHKSNYNKIQTLEPDLQSPAKSDPCLLFQPHAMQSHFKAKWKVEFIPALWPLSSCSLPGMCCPWPSFTWLTPQHSNISKRHCFWWPNQLCCSLWYSLYKFSTWDLVLKLLYDFFLICFFVGWLLSSFKLSFMRIVTLSFFIRSQWWEQGAC